MVTLFLSLSLDSISDRYKYHFASKNTTRKLQHHNYLITMT